MKLTIFSNYLLRKPQSFNYECLTSFETIIGMHVETQMPAQLKFLSAQF